MSARLQAIVQRFAARSESPAPADEDEKKNTPAAVEGEEDEVVTDEDAPAETPGDDQNDSDEEKESGSAKARAYADAAQVVTLCSLAGVSLATTANFLAKGMSPAAVGQALIGRAKTSAKTDVLAASTSVTAPKPAVSGIEQRFQSRAAAMKK